MKSFGFGVVPSFQPMNHHSIQLGGPPRLRVGAVSYLNTKPLIAGLQDRLDPAGILSLDLPSRLATQLANQDIDIGLIPAIEFFRGPIPQRPNACEEKYRIISDACIACRGNVRSVRLFFRVPPQRVSTMAVDEGSRTSVALAQILLGQRFGIRPTLKSLPIEADPESASGDAVLVIGDRAMHPQRFTSFGANWDLGNEWLVETGLPFVFAMWVGRAAVAENPLADLLERARDEGVNHIPEISRQFAASYGLSEAECTEYLGHHLRFKLLDDELRGLQAFHRLAIEWGVLPITSHPIFDIAHRSQPDVSTGDGVDPSVHIASPRDRTADLIV